MVARLNKNKIIGNWHFCIQNVYPFVCLSMDSFPMIEMNCGKRGSSFHNLESDRACGRKVDVKFIASLMDNLTGKDFGQVVRKETHAFLVINKEFLVANHEQLGLQHDDLVTAMAKPSKLPKNFEYLLGRYILSCKV